MWIGPLMLSSADLSVELDHLDRRIQGLRGAYHLIHLDLSEALRERARVQNHFNYALRQEQQRARLDLSAQDAYEARMVAAGEGNDPGAFRQALKGWQLVGLAAMREASGKGAA